MEKFFKNIKVKSFFNDYLIGLQKKTKHPLTEKEKNELASAIMLARSRGHSDLNIENDIDTYGQHDYIIRGKAGRIPDLRFLE